MVYSGFIKRFYFLICRVLWEFQQDGIPVKLQITANILFSRHFFRVLVFKDMFTAHHFRGFPKQEKNIAILWPGQSRNSKLTNIWNVTYRISYYMRCVMDYIQSAISLHRRVNLNLSNKYFF